MGQSASGSSGNSLDRRNRSLFAYGITHPGSAQHPPTTAPSGAALRCHPLLRASRLRDSRWATICTRFQDNQVHQRIARSGEGLTLEGVTLSHFRITGKLGEGGMGEVERLTTKAD